MATAELTVTANIAGLRQQLESIPGITAEQARLMAGELNRSIRASESAAKKAAAATEKAAKSARDMAADDGEKAGKMGEQFGALGGAASKLSGGLDLIAPGLGDIGRNIGDLADIGEVAAQDFTAFAESVGALGVASIAAVAAVGVFALALAPIAELILEEQRQAELTKEALDAYTSATEAAQLANDKFGKSLEGVNDYIKLATGLETQAQQTARKRVEAINSEAEAQKAATLELINSAEALKVRKEAEQETLFAKVLLDDATEEEIAQLKANRNILDDLNEGLVDNKIRLEEAAKATEDSTEFILLEAQAIDHAARNSEKKSKADKGRTKTTTDLADAQRKAAEDAAQMAAFVDRLATVEDAALTETQRLELQIKSLNQQSINLTGSTEAASGATEILRGKIKALNVEASASSLAQQVKAAKDLQSAYDDLIPPEQLTRVQQLALLQVQVDDAFARGTITAEAYAEMVRGIGKATDEARIKQEGWYAQTLQIADGVNGVAQTGAALFESLGTISEHAMERASTAYAEAIADRKRLGKDATDAEKKAAKEEVEARRNALIKAFVVDKAVKMSQALINTALAITSALTAGPIAGPILATAAGAAGAVQVAAIASEAPSFHRGGLIGQPDEMTATVRSGEAVLNPMGRARLGDQTIRDLNAGASSAGGGQAIQVVYGHRAFDYFVKSHLRTRMTLPRALGRGTRTGQRGG
jgi:hypothetical protein